MATRTVHHDQTITVRHNTTLLGTLTIQGGLPGADAGGAVFIAPQVTLTNAGQIAVLAGGAPSAGVLPGDPGTLTNHGVLANDGLITLQGGSAPPPPYSGGGNSGAAGAVLRNTGVLANAGTIVLGAGAAGINIYYNGGSGGVLLNSGTLNNTGLIEAKGAQYAGPAYANGNGGTLLDTGVLTNAGTIQLDGGAAKGTAGYIGGLGGMLEVQGALTNTGTVLIGGGIPGGAGGGYGGYGGALRVYGSMANAGQITVANLADGYRGLVEVYGVLADTGVISLEVGGAYQYGAGVRVTSHGTLALSGNAQIAGGYVFNAGQIQGSGAIAIGTVLNGGTITASGGVLSISGAIVDAGTLAAATGATLALAGSLAPTQSIVLAAGASLELAPQNAGVAIASAAGGTLDLLGSFAGAPNSATLNAADTHLAVYLLLAPGTLDLGTGAFLSATGSNQDDHLIAGAANQTLTGGIGFDTLTGSAATGDVFRDTAAGLNHDTIVDFAGSDVIDVTDLSLTGLTLAYAQHGSSGSLTLAENHEVTSITLVGTFTAASFTTGTDATGGLLIGLH